MLLEMRLRGLGVIADAVLELGPGLTVVTGETGAGKTMVVTGLGLLMGGRADPGAVREGERTAPVEGRVVVDPAGPVAARAAEAGAELDDGDVLHRLAAPSPPRAGRGRTSSEAGRCRRALLAELAETLVTVHGQTDQLRLRSPGRQREALDRFAGAAVAELLAAYRATLAAAAARRGRARRDRGARPGARAGGRAAAARPRRGRARCSPQPGEDVALARRGRAARATPRSCGRAAEQAHLALDGRPGRRGAADVAALVGAGPPGARAGRRGTTRRSPRSPTRLGEIGYLVADVAAECASYAAASRPTPSGSPPSRSAARRWRPWPARTAATSTSVLAWAAQAAPRLLELDGDEDRTAELRGRARASCAPSWRPRPASSPARARRPRPELAEAVSAELAELSMPDARLVVEVRQREDPAGLTVDLGGGPVRLAAGPDGVDDVEFLLVPHPGAPARPIAKGASGGELSRVMLGLEVVLGGRRPGADVRLRRGRRGRRRPGRARDRPPAGPAGADRAGARGHPPAAGRRLRRPAPHGREVRATAR